MPSLKERHLFHCLKIHFGLLEIRGSVNPCIMEELHEVGPEMIALERVGVAPIIEKMIESRHR